MRIKKNKMECEFFNYEIFTTFDNYPNTGLHLNDLKYKYNLTNYLSNQELTLDLIKSNFACLSIYFKDLKYTFISETPNVTLLDLISSIGKDLLNYNILVG